MIVRVDSDRLLLITQPDHAHLAGRIMEHCVPLSARPRRHSILRAIAEHDNGWTEEDAAPTVHPGTGVIVDFINAAANVRHAVWRRGVHRLADDPWTAALVAQHAITVYERFWADPAWSAFFDEMKQTRDSLLRESGGALTNLAADYTFVRLADLISLTFCLGWTDEQQVGEWVIRRSGPAITVTPDLFAGATIPITISAKEISNRPYQSDAELRDALRSARRIELCSDVLRPSLGSPR